MRPNRPRPKKFPFSAKNADLMAGHSIARAPAATLVKIDALEADAATKDRGKSRGRQLDPRPIGDASRAGANALQRAGGGRGGGCGEPRARGASVDARGWLELFRMVDW